MNSLSRIFPFLRHRRGATLLLLLCALATQLRAEYSLPPEDSRALNAAISAARYYRQLKTHEIDSVRQSLRAVHKDGAAAEARIALNISELYRPVNTDSALLYARLSKEFALHTADSTAITRARIAETCALATSGLFVPALSELNQIGQLRLSGDVKADYWKAGRIVYSYMKAYVHRDSEYYALYEDRYMAFDDSLLKALPRNDLFYQFIRGERLVKDGQLSEARRVLTYLLETLPADRNLYGMAAYQMAELYKIENNQTQYASYLAKAAVADIKGCVSEGLALPTLAEWLYAQGKLDDAFRYINFALGDANIGNVRMRTVAISSMMPMIDEAYREKLSSSRDTMMWLLALATLLLLVCGALLVTVLRQRNRSRATQQRLSALSRRQESYIGHFLGLCSSYADKLDKMSKVVDRKLTAGQSEELLKMVKAGKFAEPHNDDIYSTIDNAFLDLYPDFIFEVNKLLRPDAQIEAGDGKSLTPELRIYAFVRLGVEESTRISQILHYSVSTVYAYRNRMRNRAIDRPNFDRDVLLIGRENHE